MKAIGGMKKRWREPEWPWMIRMVFFVVVGSLGLLIAAVVYRNSSGEEGFTEGALVAFTGTVSSLFIAAMVQYAIKRIQLGRKYRKFYNQTKSGQKGE